METIIAGYYKTDHFLFRQWDRGVTDIELKFVLTKVSKAKGTQLLVVSRKLIKQCAHKKSLELFIKVDGQTLITCFYCNFQDYLNSGKKENYYLISQL